MLKKVANDSAYFTLGEGNEMTGQTKQKTLKRKPTSRNEGGMSKMYI